MTQGKIEIQEPLSDEVQKVLTKALGFTREDLLENFPVTIASTGHSKVMIGIKDINLLHSLRPDMTCLVKLSSEIGCNGYYVFTFDQGKTPLVHGRMFAPAIGSMKTR